VSDARLVRLSIALGLGDAPEVVLAPLRALYADVDRALDAAAAGLELPCKPGCDACCHESVFVSAPELLLLLEALLRRPEAERRRVTAEMLALAERFEDELEQLEQFPAGPERDEVAARVRFRCPLLGPDGACTVYAARELNARSFGASWDGASGEAYGCELTRGRLRVLPTRPPLPDARALRRRLAETVPGTERVHVFPWWFRRLRAELEG
jgi:Fe-S-cluster containining protein